MFLFVCGIICVCVRYHYDSKFGIFRLSKYFCLCAVSFLFVCCIIMIPNLGFLDFQRVSVCVWYHLCLCFMFVCSIICACVYVCVRSYLCLCLCLCPVSFVLVFMFVCSIIVQLEVGGVFTCSIRESPLGDFHPEI